MKVPRLILVIILVSSASLVSAHTPLDTGDGNNSPETALIIDDPTKSWTLYEELDEVDYYKVHLHEGEELRVSLYVSIWGEEHFTPSLVIMGPDIMGTYEPPFEHPEDLGRMWIPGNKPMHPEYEPFTPASYYYIASYRHEASMDGDYYIAVYGAEHGGRYGMALGYRETFTLVEWLKIPIDLVRIHLWEEQPLILLFLPPTLAAVIGLYMVFIRERHRENVAFVLGKLAGVLYLASGVMTLTQMVVYLVAAGISGSALLTIVFVGAQLGLGYLMLRARDMRWVAWIGYGVGGFVFWAGWIIGPILSIVVGLSQGFKIASNR